MTYLGWISCVNTLTLLSFSIKILPSCRESWWQRMMAKLIFTSLAYCFHARCGVSQEIRYSHILARTKVLYSLLWWPQSDPLQSTTKNTLRWLSDIAFTFWADLIIPRLSAMCNDWQVTSSSLISWFLPSIA